jgi:hypothetical protein
MEYRALPGAEAIRNCSEIERTSPITDSAGHRRESLRIFETAPVQQTGVFLSPARLQGSRFFQVID